MPIVCENLSDIFETPAESPFQAAPAAVGPKAASYAAESGVDGGARADRGRAPEGRGTVRKGE